VLAVRPDVAALMITCAVLKRPPVVALEHPKPRPVHIGGDRRTVTVLMQSEDGGELVRCNYRHWNEQRHAGYYGEPRCPIAWGEPKIKTAAEQRAEYTIWWRALTMLANQLDGRLKEHEAAPPDCPAMPWLTPPPPMPRVHGERTDAVKPLPLAPFRGIVAGPALKRPRLGGAVSAQN
jgi:hypothetical protein